VDDVGERSGVDTRRGWHLPDPGEHLIPGAVRLRQASASSDTLARDDDQDRVPNVPSMPVPIW
jgi:hypothetical protein